jgi:serine/threonine-protein kinase RsbW
LVIRGDGQHGGETMVRLGYSVVTRYVEADRAPVTVRVPFAASSVAVARQQLKSWMREHRCPRHAIEDGRVVVSELVGNAVRHARPLSDGTILISWCREGDDLHLAVTDGGGPTRPRTLNASSSALSGRGMAIVEALAEEWWAERGPKRATIHTRIPLH